MRPSFGFTSSNVWPARLGSLSAIGALLIALQLPGCSCGVSGNINIPRSTGGGGPGGSLGDGGDAGLDAGSILDGGLSPDGGELGDGGVLPGDGGCGLRTCASAGVSCGPIGDGCGAVLDCGSCVLPATCGGGGTHGVCGGTSGCVPKTCSELTAFCGPIDNGCGALLDCGSCDAGTCGGGGVHFQCGTTRVADAGVVGDGGLCVPLTCAGEKLGCGLMGDGCGRVTDCGGCDAGTCGGGGTPGTCGAPPVPTCTVGTCSQFDAGCGLIGDGCGGIIQCGGCDAGICGGAGIPNVCGDAIPDAGCVGLCALQVACSDGGTTSLSGTVFAPTNPDAGFGAPDPLPNALIYIPNGTVQPFPVGVSCDVCGAPASGSALVSTTSMADGGFLLTNVPVVAADGGIPLVIQLGRWRRQVTVAPVGACTNAVLPADETRLPRNHSEGDIPLIAMVTGKVDSVECVLQKMGIDEAEFTAPDGGGRVQLYVSDIDGGADGGIGGATDPTATAPLESALTGSLSALEAYDLVVFACVGAPVDRTPAEQQNLIDYTSAGGRVYATHYAYVWLFNDSPFDGTATWTTNVDTHNDPVEQVSIDTSFSKGQLMSDWMQITGASVDAGVLSLGYLRNDFSAAIAPSENWLSWTPPATMTNPTPATWPIHYTFNTPVDPDAGAQCGRVVYSDFHVENAASTNGTIFPAECTVGPMTPQEKVLEFMLFDLSSCIVQSQLGPVCAPLNCAQQGFNCGAQGDGCGNAIDCGSCDAGICGGNGAPGQCGAPSTPCKGLTCADLGLACGPASDGCGMALSCGACIQSTCGGGGVPGVCGNPPAGSDGGCAPLTCAERGLGCGPTGDGCGNLIQCGGCDGGTCGGGGTPGQCGSPSCTPLTCIGLGYDCGAAGDGCGGLLDCGLCDAGTCGGNFQPNVCGSTVLR